MLNTAFWLIPKRAPRSRCFSPRADFDNISSASLLVIFRLVAGFPFLISESLLLIALVRLYLPIFVEREMFSRWVT